MQGIKLQKNVLRLLFMRNCLPAYIKLTTLIYLENLLKLRVQCFTLFTILETRF